MNALGLRSIFIAASVQPITVHSLILPSNIKIQRSGSEFLDDSHVIRPAADLERSKDREKAHLVSPQNTAMMTTITSPNSKLLAWRCLEDSRN